MTVRVYPDAITGHLKHKLSNIINMSSCPIDVLTAMLTRIPLLPNTIGYKPIIKDPMYNIKSAQFNRLSSPRSAIIVYDDDDMVIDIKIKNLKAYCGVKIADRIALCKRKIKRTIPTRKGTTKIMCNPHHTDEVIRTLGVLNNSLRNPSEIALVVVVQTTNCFIGSISGMVLAIEYYEIPYQIEATTTKLDLSWLTIDKTLFGKKYQLIGTDNVTANEPITRRQWHMAQGYTTYITTEKGPKKIKKENDTKERFTYMQFLIALIIRIVQSSVEFFCYIVGIITGYFVVPRATRTRS